MQTHKRISALSAPACPRGICKRCFGEVVFVEEDLDGLNARFMRQSERLSFKTEYEKLKLAPGLVFLCVVCIIFEKTRWLHMQFQFGLSGYYVSLSARENVLCVNRSKTRAWWIIHRYYTIMQCELLTTLPDYASYAACRKGLHLFGLYNSVLQVFQTRCQMARLYALRSLGRIGEMSTDSSQIHRSEWMAVLLPLILLGQAIQAGQAWNFLRVYQAHPRELQILSLAALFFANVVGLLEAL